MEQHSQQAHKQQRSSPKTPFWAIALVIGCTILVAYGQYLLKRALGESTPLLLNQNLYIGMIFFIVAGLSVTYALKAGELSALHPLIGLGILWVALFSIFFLGEKLNMQHGAGIAIIILGIAFISHSSRRQR